jgi:hypothetical protein
VRESPLVTLVMIQAGDDAQSVFETQRSLSGGLPIDMPLLDTGAGTPTEDGDGPLEESDIEWIVLHSLEAFDSTRVATPFLGLVRAGDLLSSAGLARRLAALRSHPEVMLSACSVSDIQERDVAIHPLHVNQPHDGQERHDLPVTVDGRSFALDILHNGGWPLVVPSTFLIRRSVVGLQPEQGSDFDLGPVLLLLTRGGVWHDPLPGVATPVADHDQLERWEQWPDVIAEATRLGILEDHDYSRALIGHARTSAGLLRHFWTGGDGPLGRLTSGVEDLVERWTRLDRERAGGPAPLPLRVTIQLDRDQSCDPATWDSLAGLVPEDQISEVGRSDDDQPMADGDRDGAPTLTVRSGECLEVLDRHQFEQVLAGDHGRPVRISTPGGIDDRLHWPSNLSVPAGLSTEVNGGQVHSVRIRSVDSPGATHWLPASDPRQLSDAGLTFVIAAPDYTDRHAGVVALHRLCDRLNATGFRAYIEPLGEAVGITRDDWMTPLWWRKDFQDTIVVYPEIVTGNPLGAPNVVRWILNRPSWFTGSPMDPHEDDLIISFSPQIDPDYPILGLPLIDPTVFFPKDVPGRGSLLWIGKGVLPAGFDASDVTLITGEWPPSREEFAALLRKADVLYSCDWLTAVIGEALMCSTPVVLLGPQDWPADEVVLWPGMMWDHQDDLAGARHQAASFYDYYMAESLVVNGAVGDFALQAIGHFG